jgi:type IV pilus assembly protein PilA
MIVVAIIGILAAVAIPAYQDYTVRSKVSEGLHLASGAKAEVEATRISLGRYPGAATPTNVSYGLAGPTSITGNNVAKVEIDTTGALIITFNNDNAINTQTLWLKPNAQNSEGSITWSCTHHDTQTILDKYRPANCRG